MATTMTADVYFGDLGVVEAGASGLAVSCRRNAAQGSKCRWKGVHGSVRQLDLAAVVKVKPEAAGSVSSSRPDGGKVVWNVANYGQTFGLRPQRKPSSPGGRTSWCVWTSG